MKMLIFLLLTLSTNLSALIPNYGALHEKIDDDAASQKCIECGKGLGPDEQGGNDYEEVYMNKCTHFYCCNHSINDSPTDFDFCECGEISKTLIHKKCKATFIYKIENSQEHSERCYIGIPATLIIGAGTIAFFIWIVLTTPSFDESNQAPTNSTRIPSIPWNLFH